MNYYDVIFAQQKAKKDSKYFDEISDAINVLAGTETTYTPSEMASAILDAIPTETASGNPIHITDAANYPTESVVTTLEPVQDLHGYSKPWPAGGGKNLLPITAESQTTNGITFTVNKDNAGNVVSITANGTATANAVCFLNTNFKITDNSTYIFSGCPANGSVSTFRMECYYRGASGGLGSAYDVGSGVTINIADKEGAIRIDAFIIAVLSGATVNNIVFKPMIRLASVTDPTFEPYSNECPITGHTGVELTRTGKNLFNPDTFVRGLLNNPTGELEGSYLWITSDFVSCQGTVTIQGWKDGSESNFCVRFSEYDANRKCIKNTPNINVSDVTTYSRSITLENNTRYVRASFGFDNKQTSVSAFFDTNRIQLELGSTATTYEPYTPETHSQTFPQAQSPVYGCEVDWTEGVLRVDKVKQKLQNMSTDQSKTGFIRVNQQLSSAKVPQTSQTLLSNVLISDYIGIIDFNGNPSKPYSFWYNERAVYVALSTDDFATANDWNTYLNSNDVYIIYELETPLEIPLTPEVITLLKGENNVWTDAGSSEIEYKVDLQGYIQKLIDEASIQASTLSVSPLSLGKSAAVLTDGEDGGEIKDVESVDEADEVEEESAEDKKADEPAEESEKAEDLTVKKEIAEELAETEKVEKVKETEDIKETEEHESEVEE